MQVRNKPLLVKQEVETNILEHQQRVKGALSTPSRDCRHLPSSRAYPRIRKLQAANKVSGAVVNGKYLYAAHFPDD